MQGLYLLSGKTSYGRILWRLDLDYSNHSEIWQAPRQQFCRDSYQISKWYDHYNTHSRRFETSRDLVVRRPSRWVNRNPGFPCIWETGGWFNKIMSSSYCSNFLSVYEMESLGRTLSRNMYFEAMHFDAPTNIWLLYPLWERRTAMLGQCIQKW